MKSLPPYSSPELIAERLPLIFPEGTPNRAYCTRKIAASTVFAMLYIGATEEREVYCSPQHIYRMTEEQSVKKNDLARNEYNRCVLSKNCKVEGTRWYEDNTREPIRDETLRDGLIQVGAVLVNKAIPTTSSKPRYALRTEFVELFNPSLVDEQLKEAIDKWQDSNLSKSALARVKINAKGGDTSEKVLVKYPNGKTKHLDAGPSSWITKEVVETFANNFLIEPFVLWLSESGAKKGLEEEELTKSLGINIDVSGDLPDLIIVDMGSHTPYFVFVEVVATDGAITPRRMDAILGLIESAGFDRSQVLFVSAYMDRQSAGFKKTISNLAWNSYAWFASEPENLFILHQGKIALSEIRNKYNSPI